MKLTPEQLQRFDDEGYLFFPNYFSPEETQILKASIPEVFAQRREENVREKTGDVVRTAFAVHTYHPVFEALIHHPRFVEPAEQFLQRPDLHPPVQDQRKGRLRRRRLAVAPGLRHLEGRRRHARGARHEPRGVRRRGERVQRPAVVHPAEPQEGRDRGQARPHHDVVSACG